MIARPTPFCADANIGDARIFRAEVRGQKINLTNRFERGLAGSGLAKNTAVCALPIERKTGPITLSPDKFERAVGGALRDVWI